MPDAHADVTILNDRISVRPDPLPVTGKNVNLHWTIVTDGWTFPSDGIVIDKAAGQFSDPSANGKKFKWKDKDDFKADYKYTINVINGSRRLTLDPTIENQNGASTTMLVRRP